MKRIIIWLVVLAVFGGGGFLAYRYHESHKPPDITYKSVAVTKRKITGSVTASGTLSALVTVQVGSQVSGSISKLNADFNSQVKKGQLVAKIDPQLFQAAVEQAQANYESAKAGVVKAEAQSVQSTKQLERMKQLREQGLAALQDLETAEAGAASDVASVAVAKASLAQAKANLDQALVNLSYTNIVSPIDGVVISRSVDVGQTVAASLSAPTIFTIAQDLKKMQVDTSVSEGDVGRLTPGMSAFFTVDAYPGKKFRGTISDVRNAATTVQNVVTYDAVIKVDNDELKLRPGMTANVTIIFAERDDVIAVSNQALRFRPTGPDAPSASASVAGPAGAASGEHQHRFDGVPGQRGGGHGGGHGHKNDDGTETKTVFIMHGDKPSPVVLKIGLSDGTSSEVVSGELHEGDLVAIEQEGGPDAVTSAPTMKRLF